ncbi:holo-[acyl-carrier-protein] synthase [Mycoplasmopsis californica HAZ160_1]|uniref:Holo-[acyl-carrier-protein] synthase n=1 Tax=Mycoplasmopsis californica HAZ160_1 TaxID=1397850 RepID=A0AAT9F7I1_9BACT|nr:4'-phosphopantetheinyl transferase superfamily protein [Mycoplasmopsis californica]BAP00830.1 holo-[acyl-carrier-protein] synthase [Mycoplasmopsis californica HAZ160_1]BBG42466.1 holo-[acyl-carrier-protein] synthase [Mycoplasmopsis californica]BBG43040.1 holo-[acyl-carrier-protein] synthase [Mycoplasmopsis californica]
MKIGLDATTIKRFKNMPKGFEKRFCHPNELLLLEKEKHKADFLASIWAIKEALFKADNNFADFRKIELKKDQHGWEHSDWNISTTNEGDLVIAVVVKKE